jgi:hypothetical protein
MFPSFENGHTITVFQDTPKSIIINVHTPVIKVSSDKSTSIELNVSYLDILDFNVDVLTQEIFYFTSSTDIDTGTPGFYLLEFLSPEITEITIKGKGIYIGSLIVMIFLLGLNAALITRDYYKM